MQFENLNRELVSGELLEIKYKLNNEATNVFSYLTDKQGNELEFYGGQAVGESFIINRFLNTKVETLNNSFYLQFVFYDNEDFLYTYSMPIRIAPSVIIESVCALENCESLTGNVVHQTPQKIKVSTTGFSPIKYSYSISTLNDVLTFENEYNNPVDIDWIQNVVMPAVPNSNSSYIATLRVEAEDMEGNVIETSLPFRVVRPMEVKHYGKYELAEIYEPIPVSGCIVGSIGNNVSYSESTTETRQNSVNIVISKSWSDSNSTNVSNNTTEGISIGETRNVVNSSSLSESETFSENETVSSSTSDGTSATFSTDDGESWSWNISETDTTGSSNTSNGSTTIGGNASVTVGVEGEGSLPFLAKASGSVATTVGVSGSYTNGSSETNSNSSSSGRGYTTSGSQNSGRSFGSVQNVSNSSSLSGTYAYNNSDSFSSSQGNGQSSTRVWNMSEAVSSGKVVTTGDSESISETIVESTSSTTTFSYSSYIPLGRSGIFYRQTSRWTRLSEIITYDLNGFPSHAGYISMSSWSWAPSLSIGESCREIPQPQMEPATCYIPPCGE